MRDRKTGTRRRSSQPQGLFRLLHPHEDLVILNRHFSASVRKVGISMSTVHLKEMKSVDRKSLDEDQEKARLLDDFSVNRLAPVNHISAMLG